MTTIEYFPYLESIHLNDKLLIQSSFDGAYYHIRISDLKVNDTDKELNRSDNEWAYFTIDTSTNKSIICDTQNNPINLSLEPLDKPGIIDVINTGKNKIYLNFLNQKFRYKTSEDKVFYIDSNPSTTRLVFVDELTGWIEISENIKEESIGYEDGFILLLEGDFSDSSGNNNHASPLGKSPTIGIGIDDNSVMTWDGTGTQELEIPYFLSNTESATLYCVFTCRVEHNYNLIRTRYNDDYWHFFYNSRGYIGTFSYHRIEGYPSEMPSDGSHLVSIHANINEYELLLNNVSQGIISNPYNSGDTFRIGTNDKKFKGDIALIMVYPYYIDSSSISHINNISAIKKKFPSLDI